MKKLVTLIAFFVFTAAGSLYAQWTTVCGTGDGMVVNLTSFRDTVYATGFFTTICGESAEYIAKWDGTSWYPVDTGLATAGHRLSVIDDELYVAQYGSVDDSNWVMKWDGSHFVKIGEGIYLTTSMAGSSHIANIYDVVKYRGRLIATGEFDVVGNRSVSGIMQWSGTEWDTVGSGLAGGMGTSGVMYPHQMLVVDTSLYVVGNFVTAGGVTVNGVARWDGYAWHAMGAGFNLPVYSISLINGELYAGGDFTMSGSTVLQRIAKWDGSNWVHPGFGVYYSTPFVNAYVHTAMQVGTRGVFEGGFDRVIYGLDTIEAHSIIAVGTAGLDVLAGGIPNGEFEGLLPYEGTDILVGGAIFSGGTTTRVAKYHFTPLMVTKVAKDGVATYPNPFTKDITIDMADEGTARICNMMGQVVGCVMLVPGHNNTNLHSLPSGVYYLHVTDSMGKTSVSKIVKQ